MYHTMALQVNETGNETNVRCALFDGDVYKCNVVLGVQKSMAALSFVGCIFMMVLIWLFRKYKLFAQRLILYLTIAAFFSSIAYLMRQFRVGIADGPYCDFIAFWVTLWAWSSLAWTCCITFNLMMSLARMISTEKFEIIYHFIGWGIPLFVSLLPFIGDHYGPAGAWCWITNEHGDATQWRFGIWYGPLFVLIIVMFTCYVYVFVKFKKMIGVYRGGPPNAQRNRTLFNTEVRPLVAYPCVYLLLSIFALINRIQSAITDDRVFGIVLLHAMSSPLLGASNALVYGLDKTTRKLLNMQSIKEAFQRKTDEPRGIIQEYNPPQGQVTTVASKRNNEGYGDTSSPDDRA